MLRPGGRDKSIKTTDKVHLQSCGEKNGRLKKIICGDYEKSENRERKPKSRHAVDNE